MAAMFEDTAAGAADITGDPSPVSVRQPAEVRGDQKKAVNQKRMGGPQEGGDQTSPPSQDARPADKKDSAAQPDVGKEFQQGNQALMAGQPFHQKLNPFSPIDWAKQSANDAWLTYQTGRRVAAVGSAFLDPQAISSSVNNIWEQDDAASKVVKMALEAATGGVGMSDQAAQGRAAGAAGEVLPLTGNPINALGGSNLAANLAIGAGQGVLSAAPGDQQTAALTWAAITGAILGAGHIPPEMRAALGPNLVKQLTDALGRNKVANRAYVAGSQGAQDFLRQYMEKGGFPGRVQRVASAAKPDVRGEITLKGGQARAALKAAQVSSVPELIDKARTEGISEPAVIKKIVDNYPGLGLTHDLKRVNPGDVALGDPAASLKQIHNLGDPGRTAAYLASMNHFKGLIDHIGAGLWADGADPAKAMLRNLAGHNRPGGSTDLMYQGWVDSMKSLAKTHGISGEAVAKAIGGDAEAFAALPPEGQGIARQWRVFGNALMHESQSTGYGKDFVGNWLPLQLKEDASKAARGGGGKFVGALKTASKAHKAEAIRTDAQGNLVLTQKYQSAFEANADQAARRATLIQELTSPEAITRDELAKVPGVKAIRRAVVTGDYAAARAQAQAFVRSYYPDFETDFFKIADRAKGAGYLKAIRTHQALNAFTESLQKDGRPSVVKVADSHEANTWAGEGYKPLPGREFQGYLFHPGFHGDIEPYVDNARKGLQNQPVFKQALQLEGKSLAGIMFSPLIHTMNIASRFGAASMMHPLEIAHYIANGRALNPLARDVESAALRKEAIDSGYVANQQAAQSWFDNLSGRMNDALGHVDQEVAKVSPLRNAGDMARHPLETHKQLNRFFWNWYRDFGTMMYHVEKSAAMKHGFSETDARVWGGLRAKSWVGLANPEDMNPMLHDALRGILFAPAWWKSWIQLAVPVYRKTGMSESHAAYAAYQGAKTAAAFLAFQKVTGNLTNFVLTSSTPWAHDGHFQNQNLPGNQDRIEATAPWLDHVPGFQGIASNVSKTGGRRTMENPFGRQERDTEMAMGLESGHPDWKPEDLRDGISKVMVSRLAPLIDGLAALGNVDLYRTATTNALEHVNPSQPSGPSVLSPLYMALMMTPLGSQWAEKMTASLSDPKAGQQVDGPFGQKVPKAMADTLGNTKTAAERTLFTWLTGTNPPYDYAEKSRGTPISDADYQRYTQAKESYSKQMASLSAQALGGQITPSAWLDQYKKANAAYRTTSEGIFRSSPHYVNGSEGLLNDYEDLYNQATDPQSGEVDFGKLDSLQAQFRQKNANNPELGQMDQLLHQQDTQYPMLSLYHKTTAAYGKWQAGYASQHGVDINNLRQEISQYGALYGDQRASQKYLAQHRDLAAYEHAKTTQWETSPAGLMYGLLYNTSAVSRYMAQHHLTAQQVEQEAQSAES